MVQYREEFPDEHDDPLIEFLHRTIRIAIKALAVGDTREQAAIEAREAE